MATPRCDKYSEETPHIYEDYDTRQASDDKSCFMLVRHMKHEMMKIERPTGK